MSLARLQALLASERRCFAPFFVLGDPSPEASVALALAAVEAGADMLELGFPFSDPTADGPEVAAAATRARAAGASTGEALRCLEAIRARTDVPLNLLVYANLAHARGFGRFAREVAEAGASSLLCPDLGLEESAPLAAACADAALGLVQLAGPGSSDARMAALGRGASAFVYLVSHQGTTGARTELAPGTAGLVARAAAATGRPLCVGFGLSEAEHLAAVFAAGARIAVVGSALVRLVRAHVEEGAPLVDAVRARCAALAAGARASQP